MSLLLESLPAFHSTTEQLDVVGLRYVDASVRLHNWSLPVPRCIHDLPLVEQCDHCDAELTDDEF
jgi:hypothetical protein